MQLEKQIIDWLLQHAPTQGSLPLGIGDDAAVLAPTSDACVVTTDMLTDEVDFRLSEIDPQLAGHKALGANLSDLAAMAARPVAVFVSLALPRGGTLVNGNQCVSAFDLATGLYRGMLPLLSEFNLVLAGGDTNTWDGPLVVSITAIGHTSEHGPLTRSGARVGDRLLVTGTLGGSILGRHLRVEPRVSTALSLHDRYELHAGIDISDGLALDASRLAQASGCGVVLDLQTIPLSNNAHTLSKSSGRTPLNHALADGEDFELLLAVPANVADQLTGTTHQGVPLTCIGHCIAEPGLWQQTASGELAVLAPRGYQHESDA